MGEHVESQKPFGEALADLLGDADEYVTHKGRPKLAPFAAELMGFSYEVVRKAFSGERRPSMRLMEECARVLRVRPTYFAEYRIETMRRSFDPKYVGWEQAGYNLAKWEAIRDNGEAA